MLNVYVFNCEYFKDFLLREIDFKKKYYLNLFSYKVKIFFIVI